MAASGASSSCARPRPTEDRRNGLEAASKKTPYRAGTSASACTRATPAGGEGDGVSAFAWCASPSLTTPSPCSLPSSRLVSNRRSTRCLPSWTVCRPVSWRRPDAVGCVFGVRNAKPHAKGRPEVCPCLQDCYRVLAEWGADRGCCPSQEAQRRHARHAYRASSVRNGPSASGPLGLRPPAPVRPRPSALRSRPSAPGPGSSPSLRVDDEATVRLWIDTRLPVRR